MEMDRGSLRHYSGSGYRGHMMSERLLRLNTSLDATVLASRFAERQRLQIRNVLERESAEAIAKLLLEETPWGVTWQAGADGPHRIRQEQLGQFGASEAGKASAKLHAAMQREDFAFIYSQYRLSVALQEGWSHSPAHAALVKELNDEDILEFIRQVTGVREIRVCDAQASHYGPGQFLSLHQDISIEKDENRLVAYVLSLCPRWRPDWGGYLNFFGEDGDIVEGYMPRFNCLNLFSVPRDHNVSLVAPFAGGHRVAITGWFRSR